MAIDAGIGNKKAPVHQGVKHGKSRFTWQDGLTIAAIFLAVGVTRSEDMLFLSVFTGLAAAFAIAGLLSQRPFTKGRILSALFVIAVAGSLCIKQLGTIREKELTSPSGDLVPAGLPFPLSGCAVGSQPEHVNIFAGRNVVSIDGFPVTVFRFDRTDLVNLDKSPSGGLLLTASIFDDRDNLIAQVEKNKYLSTNLETGA